MQIIEATRDVRTSGVGEVHKATIRATSKVFSFFSDQTYTDKPRTILRELVANAEDSRRMAKSATQTVVTLPTPSNPILSVKDGGLGMSHEFITGPFMEYANGSTKSDSNDVIGGFGIGSKSPFSYVDQFLIRSVHNGTAGTYSMFKDEDGCPAIATLDRSPTDEPNGVEVMVSIKEDDISKFREAAEEVLGYFPDPIKLIGGEIKRPDYIAQGEGWAVRRQSGTLAVIMGGVRYPVDRNSLPWDLRNDELVDYGVDLTLPIGSCSVALSREALSMDDRTTASILKAMRDMRQDIIDSFATIFDDCSGKWDAAKMLSDMAAGNRNRYRLVSQHARYKGEPLQERIIPDCEISIHHRRGRINTISRFDFVRRQTVFPGRTSVLIIDDLPVEPRSRTLARVKEAYGGSLQYDRHVVVARGKSVEHVLKELGNPSEYVLTSTLQPPAIQRRPAGTRQKIYSCRCSSPMRGDLIKLANLDGREILVEMNSFQMPQGFKEQWNSGIVDREKVVFANKLAAEKLRGKLIPWAEAFAKARGETLSKLPVEEIAFAKFIRSDTNISGLMNTLARVRPHLGELTRAQKSRPFGKIVALYDRYMSVTMPDEHHLIEPKRPPRYNSVALIKALNEQQPEVNWMLNNIIWPYTSDRAVLPAKILKGII